MKRQQRSFLTSIALAMFTALVAGSGTIVFGQPKIEIVSLPKDKADINRAIALKPESFGDSMLVVGTNMGKAMFLKIRSDETIINKPVFRPFPLETRSLIREIGFYPRGGYLLSTDGIYFSNGMAMDWQQIASVNDKDIRDSGSTAELWGMTFVNDSKVCVAGVYFKNNSDDIQKDLLLCTNNISAQDDIKWYEPEKPDDKRLQLTNIYYNQRAQHGWAVGTDGAEGFIWYSNNGGARWEDQKITVEEPLLGITSVGNKVLAVGYNGLIYGKGISTNSLTRLSAEATINPNIDPNPNRNPNSNRNLNSKLKKGDKVRLKRGVMMAFKIGKTDEVTARIREFVGNNEVKLEDIRVKPEDLEEDVIDYLNERPIFITELEKIEDDDDNTVVAKVNLGKTTPTTNSNWAKISVPALRNKRATLRSVKFADDGMVGFIVGDAGTVLYTSDGGMSWKALTTILPTQQPLLNTVEFYSIFIDKSYCWIAGSKGTIVRVKYGV